MDEDEAMGEATDERLDDGQADSELEFDCNFELRLWSEHGLEALCSCDSKLLISRGALKWLEDGLPVER